MVNEAPMASFPPHFAAIGRQRALGFRRHRFEFLHVSQQLFAGRSEADAATAAVEQL
jgi:hypothetical protein